MALKLNGSAKWIGIIITAVSATIAIMSGMFGGRLTKVEANQNGCNTRTSLLEQKIDRIDKNVTDIHKVIFIPKL